MNTFEQDKRLQEFIQLTDSDHKLNSLQLTETAEDFYAYESEEGEMSFDTFKERLRIRYN